jgi:hypothetical protein
MPSKQEEDMRKREMSHMIRRCVVHFSLRPRDAHGKNLPVLFRYEAGWTSESVWLWLLRGTFPHLSGRDPMKISCSIKRVATIYKKRCLCHAKLKSILCHLLTVSLKLLYCTRFVLPSGNTTSYVLLRSRRNSHRVW